MSDPMIAALLGPGQPEVDCETCFAELDRYVELEISHADAEAAVPGMRAHLGGCGACREEYESLSALLDSVPEGRPTGSVR
jgi:hypothetical protein